MSEQDRAEFEAWARNVGADAHEGSEDLEWSPSARRYTKDLTHNYYLAWLAARRTQDAKVRALVEFVDEAGHYSWCRHVIHPTQDCSCPHTLAAQLKQSQSDSPPQE